MEISLPCPDKEALERMQKGCEHYGLKWKYNQKQNPAYFYIEVYTEEDIINIFWLGANLATPKIESSLYRSTF